MTMYPNLKYQKLDPEAPDLGYARPGDAGLDLCSMETVDIAPQGTVKVGSGIRMEIPEGFYGQMVPRSSVSTKRGITLANTPGTIDSSYRGEVIIALYNQSTEMQHVERGERVAQIIILEHAKANPVIADELSETERGTGGFGSTGAMGNMGRL